MRLFFLRHGIAEPSNSSRRDFDRALTPEGGDEMAGIARALRRLKVTPALVLSSPLVRARQTAEAVAPVLGASIEVVDELASGAHFESFQRLVRRFANGESLMLVGHEPDFSEAAAALIGAESGAISLKKAGLIRVDVEGRFERGRGRLRWLLTPHQLELIGESGRASAEDEAADESHERPMP